MGAEENLLELHKIQDEVLLWHVKTSLLKDQYRSRFDASRSTFKKYLQGQESKGLLHGAKFLQV